MTTAMQDLPVVAWAYEEYRQAFMGNMQWFEVVQFVQPPNDPTMFRNIVPLGAIPAPANVEVTDCTCAAKDMPFGRCCKATGAAA